LQAWINDLTINFPCPQATIAVTQTITNAVAQAVAQATSSATAQATAQATSAATSAVVSVPSAPAPTTSTASSSAPEPSSSSSSSETKTETKTEAKSEEKSESKSESKSEKKSEEKKSSGKSVAKVNPIIYSSDFTVAPTTDVVSIIASVGMSQSSLMGNSSWGISSMIWSTFDQFALSGRYTKMNFNAGKLESITNYGITGVYLGGAVLGFGTIAYIYPLGRYGVTGANYTLSVAGADVDLNVSNNILVFYTLPVKVSKHLTISPDLYISGSTTGFLTSQKLFVTSDDVGFLTGASFDIVLTKRFKFNFGLKMSLNTNPLVPISFLGMMGTKINL
jgi:hypothetical protein